MDSVWNMNTCAVNGLETNRRQQEFSTHTHWSYICEWKVFSRADLLQMVPQVCIHCVTEGKFVEVRLGTQSSEAQPVSHLHRKGKNLNSKDHLAQLCGLPNHQIIITKRFVISADRAAVVIKFWGFITGLILTLSPLANTGSVRNSDSILSTAAPWKPHTQKQPGFRWFEFLITAKHSVFNPKQILKQDVAIVAE